MNLSELKQLIKEEVVAALDNKMTIHVDDRFFTLSKGKNKISSFWFEKLDTRPGGSRQYSLLPNEYKKKYKEAYGINSFHTNEEFRRMGFGKILLIKFIEYIKHKGAQILTLGVWKNNINAINLYEKMGFKIYNEFGTACYMCLEL